MLKEKERSVAYLFTEAKKIEKKMNARTHDLFDEGEEIDVCLNYLKLSKRNDTLFKFIDHIRCRQVKLPRTCAIAEVFFCFFATIATIS